MNSLQQILLPGFAVRSDAFFSNFYAPDSLRLVKDSLMALVNGNAFAFIYLCGMQGVGKTHLLQATCNLAEEHGKTALYLPLAEVRDFSPAEILENTESFAILCLDDLDVVAGRPAWEEALFHLYNSRLVAGKCLVLAAEKTAVELPVQLPDLRTRLTACLSLPVGQMDDAGKAGLVRFRAHLTGMEMNDACVQFVIHRSGRSIGELVRVVERLDRESLVAGRKITVPFIKAVFGW